jgi:hypothetical protein
MGHPRNEPLFTPQEWLIVVSLWIAYAGVLFSMDPEWVGWAAPLAFGGALVASSPPPSSALPASPAGGFEAAFLLSLLSVAALELLQVRRGEPSLGWLAKLRESFRAGGLRRQVQRFQQMMLLRNFAVRTLQSSRRGSSIGQEIWHRHQAAQGRVIPSPQSSGIIPRSLREGSPEDLRSLR